MRDQNVSSFAWMDEIEFKPHLQGNQPSYSYSFLKLIANA